MGAFEASRMACHLFSVVKIRDKPLANYYDSCSLLQGTFREEARWILRPLELLVPCFIPGCQMLQYHKPLGLCNEASLSIHGFGPGSLSVQLCILFMNMQNLSSCNCVTVACLDEHVNTFCLLQFQFLFNIFSFFSINHPCSSVCCSTLPNL